VSPLNLYARVRFLLLFAHETAGAARTRHSLRPPIEAQDFWANLGRLAPRDHETVSAVWNSNWRGVSAPCHHAIKRVLARFRQGSGKPADMIRLRKLVLPDRIELSTSPLPMECSTTELRQHARDRDQESADGGSSRTGGSCHKASRGASTRGAPSGRQTIQKSGLGADRCGNSGFAPLGSLILRAVAAAPGLVHLGRGSLGTGR
jgi:hypothetical protein